MSNIFLNRNRESIGQFSPEEVLQGLDSGRFLPTDLAWREGMETWVPLSELAVLLLAERPAPSFTEDENVLEATPPLPVEAVVSPEVQPAWERRDQLGALPAMVETLRQFYSRPAETFAQLSPSGSMTGPLIFNFVLSFLTGLVSTGYQLAFQLVNPSQIQGAPAQQGPTYFVLAYVGAAVLLPVFILIGSYLSAALTQFLLFLAGGANEPYRATFRIVCYSTGAASLLQVVPLCGWMLYSVYWMVLTVIGVSKVHRTESWRAILAVLTPLIICCGMIIGTILLIAARYEHLISR